MFTSYKKVAELLNSKLNNDISDSELLDNYYHDHDTKWLGILLPRYTLLLLGVCMKYLKNEEDARDSVQQIFLKTISELKKYKVEYFKSWIYMIAKNHCLMQLRANGRRTVEINENSSGENYDPESKAGEIEKNASIEQLHLALAQLNKEQNRCLTLFYLEKRSYQEITSDTGFNMMQVKSHIQNGKRNMRSFLLDMNKNQDK